MSDEEIAALRMALATLPMSQILAQGFLPEDLAVVFGVEEHPRLRGYPSRVRQYLSLLPDAYYKKSQEERLRRVPLLAQEFNQPFPYATGIGGLRRVAAAYEHGTYWGCAWANTYTGLHIDV